ncbi:hypothetical protein GM3708_639 [Geminocystis sp. NIES-3708]|uniref:hypothetical protein n=1 Tax=Geminocystis sp. NIES-3708 TaxID=1615909 RepID=UPI0005FC4337|nr:hypothetical protein [Geminocystis sp. NIES-3708]BAQ60233.1 hypothetical protein GM3708_639 [Geminocystis sp. NIES-3708]
MSKIEEVKAKIRNGEIEEAMAMAMSEVMKIEIVTTTNDQNNSSSSSYRTFIDLLQNEIEHDLGENQVENLHFQEVEKAHEKILQNAQSLQKMFNILQTNISEFN